MRARQILSKNLRALMDEAKATNGKLSAIRKVAEASQGKLSNGTVGRIAAGSHTTDIDTLADLADVFGMQPWQLLVENLNPKALPRLADASLLTQIRQIVDSVPTETADKPSGATDEQTLQRVVRSTEVGPALKEAFSSARNIGKAASGGARPASKSQGRRRG